MRPADYLLDRLPLIAAFALAVGFLLLVVHLGIAPLTSGDTAYILLLAAVAGAIILGIDWLRQAAFRREVARRLAEGIATDAPLPAGVTREQQAIARLHLQSHRAAAAALQAERGRAEQHRTFVDLWVHQMKTPLAVLELTAREKGDEFWEAVAEETEGLAHGLEQMLVTARLERFDLDLAPATVDAVAVARAAVNELKGAWVRTGVYPRVEAPDAPVPAETDPKWLHAILRQFLTNAIRYSRRGSTVTVTVTDDERQTVLSVRDEGIGIPAADLPRVFDRFFTGSNGRRASTSTGMGLYLAAEIASRLGHELLLESEPGAGTIASVVIRPAGRRQAPELATDGAGDPALRGEQER